MFHRKIELRKEILIVPIMIEKLIIRKRGTNNLLFQFQEKKKYNNSTKKKAILLYIEGLGINAIARIIQVVPSFVLYFTTQKYL